MVGAKTSDDEDTIRSFLSNFEIQPLSEEISEETIHLRKAHRLKIPDAIVYATAKTEGCLLISRNTKDFNSDWPDLRVPYQV
jgi:predicted nucleic acid-binding protein